MSTGHIQKGLETVKTHLNIFPMKGIILRPVYIVRSKHNQYNCMGLKYVWEWNMQLVQISTEIYCICDTV